MTSLILNAQVNKAPTITAQGKQAFCVGNPIHIVTDFTITDPDDDRIAAFFIQISSGYQVNFDVLTLTGNYPFITSFWNSTEGKLTLTSSLPNEKIPLIELEKAIKEITFTTTANTIIEEKTFSLSIGNANYLPLTDHFYEFVEAPNITWKNAKIAAENRFYFGRQGYLATLTNQIEADFAGKQASGTGWIGASDEENEGEWKWVTGPEAGTVFWNGTVDGTTPNFAFWNNNEPNDYKLENPIGEDYAHITDRNAPDIIEGSWNDLPNVGGTGFFIPKGYIVEYGKPEESPLNIVASTSIYIPKITSITGATICEFGNATLTATSNEGEIFWYKTPNNGNESPEFIGNNFKVNNIPQTTTYYAAVSLNGCVTLPRTAVTINVTQKPQIRNTTGDVICGGIANLNAEVLSGQLYWYDSKTSTTPLFIGNSFNTIFLTTTTSYFVEAINTNCGSSDRKEVIAKVDNTIPEFDVPQNTFVLCTGVGSVNLEIINPKGNYSYVWQKNGETLSESTPNINVNSSGNYAVTARSEAGCESETQNITVIISDKANITLNDIVIIDDSENNSIQISNANLGSGNYEFAIDNEFDTYQKDGFFNNLSTGTHKLFIKDLGGCETQTFVFSILGYPKFFTPNEDGKNDVWNITGFDKTLYTYSEISIFNRFGNLIYKIDKNSNGWNGTYKGKNLPSSTYWFNAILTDINGLSIEKTGNFSLIRK
jgi:gliding motility-associated-like protein